MLLEKSGKIAEEGLKTLSQTKTTPTCGCDGDGNKLRCYKEQYCIGTWNVRSINQEKLEVVKQEMARVNIDILEVSELKRTGMGEFNTDDHCICYCRQESLRRNGVALRVNKRVQNAELGTVTRTTDCSLLVSKANHSLSQQSKSMPQTLMQKKLRLNGSKMMYKNF